MGAYKNDGFGSQWILYCTINIILCYTNTTIRTKLYDTIPRTESQRELVLPSGDLSDLRPMLRCSGDLVSRLSRGPYEAYYEPHKLNLQ